MQYRKSIISLSILILSILVSGFTNLTHPIDPPRKPIPGNPDPEAGIVVKFDSTAEDILADSSQNIKFKALLYSGNTKIRHLSIGLLDQTPKRFRLVDDACGFVADETYYASVSFHEGKDAWYGMYFAPFLPGLSKTESEIKPILDKWVQFFNESGWEIIKPKQEKGGWEPYQLPNDGISDTSVYQKWKCNGHKIVMLVHPNSNNTFYMRIFMENYSLFYDDKVQE